MNNRCTVEATWNVSLAMLFLVMRIHFVAFVLSLSFSTLCVAEDVSAPEPQTGSIIGTVTDVQVIPIAAAAVTLDGPNPSDHQTATVNENGFFAFHDLRPAVSYRIAVQANGFANWKSPAIVLSPGETNDLGDIKLAIANVETSVTAVLPEQLAIEQVKVEEKQRILGVIPNFYVSYDPQFVPLTSGLKFKLALRASTDVATIAGVAFLAGIDQAADTPNYGQGAEGFGQRFGAGYADSFTGIMIGGAVLPSLLHQDPRYFYQGTGTTKSRVLHAISAPFVAKGDNGRWQPNYSSIGGDLASGAISNLYYPESNRGPGLVFNGALIATGGRIANALAQEFLLRKLTTKSHNQP
jgi:hypothetical protein